MSLDANPFRHFFKVRFVVLSILGIWLTIGLLYGALGSLDLLPLPSDDPLLAPIFYMLLVATPCLGLVVRSQRTSVRLSALWGHWPQHFSWGELLLLTGGLFLFSLGAFQVSYLGLSWVAPSLVESTLEQSLLGAAAETSRPGLYHALVLISTLVVAPLAEEFLFRGILFHRWGSKWSLGLGIIGPSVVFGVVHSNLLGLFVFGIVMSLLYLRSGCLLVPVVAHSLNNAIVSLLEVLISPGQGDIAVDALGEFRDSWWVGFLCLLVSTPLIWRFIRRHWPLPGQGLPYFANLAADHPLARDSS